MAWNGSWPLFCRSATQSQSFSHPITMGSRSQFMEWLFSGRKPFGSAPISESSPINPVTGKSLNYAASDGLHGNLFNAGAVCQTTSGKIYFGSTTGLVAFDPTSMQANPYKPKIYFSRIFINHREILPGRDNSPLTKPLYETDVLQLKPDQNSFSIEFVAQNYLNPQKNQFRYRLKSFDPNLD